MEITLVSCEDNGIDIFRGKEPVDLEYTKDVLSVSEDPSNLQVFSIVRTRVGIFGMNSAFPKCNILLQNCLCSEPG